MYWLLSALHWLTHTHNLTRRIEVVYTIIGTALALTHTHTHTHTHRYKGIALPLLCMHAGVIRKMPLLRNFHGQPRHGHVVFTMLFSPSGCTNPHLPVPLHELNSFPRFSCFVEISTYILNLKCTLLVLGNDLFGL